MASPLFTNLVFGALLIILSTEDGRRGRICRSYLADIPRLPEVRDARTELLEKHG